MLHNYLVVDAFTGERFGGNPAAIVLDARGLADEAMQAIAAEFNLSETTFVLPVSDPAGAGSSGRAGSDDSLGAEAPGLVGADLRFRWFTPTVEVDMCGHATIAGIHALLETGRLPEAGGVDGAVRIETRSGVLSAFVETAPDQSGQMLWLELIAPTLGSADLARNDLADALGLTDDHFDDSLAPVSTQDGDLLLFVDSATTLNGVRPNFQELGAVLGSAGLRGLCLATTGTLSTSIHVQSRFFAPAVGVNEDPVTGSVHGPLAVLLAQNGRVPTEDGTAAMVCVQGIPGGRTGVVFALVEQGKDGRRSVRIGGQAVTSMTGALQTDEPDAFGTSAAPTIARSYADPEPRLTWISMTEQARQLSASRSRFVAIVNPASGRRDMVPVVEQIGRRLSESGARLEILPTACAGDATQIAQRASATADAVLVVGGDGTVCEVVNGLIDTSVPIVVLRTGTENLIARELDMPRSPEAVADTLLHGRSVACDVGEANGRRFLAIVGVGFDAECVQRMVRLRSGHITHLDYFWPIWRTFWAHRFPLLRVFADESCIFQGKGFALCGGFPRYSIGLRPLARARYDDGLLDVCVFPCSSKLELIRQAAGLFLGTHLKKGGAVYRQATRIRIESPERVLTEVDGELGEDLPLECRVLKHAATFLLP